MRKWKQTQCLGWDATVISFSVGFPAGQVHMRKLYLSGGWQWVDGICVSAPTWFNPHFVHPLHKWNCLICSKLHIDLLSASLYFRSHMVYDIYVWDVDSSSCLRRCKRGGEGVIRARQTKHPWECKSGGSSWTHPIRYKSVNQIHTWRTTKMPHGTVADTITNQTTVNLRKNI